MKKLYVIFPITLLIGAVALLCFGEYAVAAVVGVTAAVAAIPLFLPRKKHSDPDPTGTKFISDIVSMTETISRATAERDCGIYTQMLYEQARFCEPSTNSNLRTFERKILIEICKMKPTDSDSEIAQKCESIISLLKEREEAAKSDII